MDQLVLRKKLFRGVRLSCALVAVLSLVWLVAYFLGKDPFIDWRILTCLHLVLFVLHHILRR